MEKEETAEQEAARHKQHGLRKVTCRACTNGTLPDGGTCGVCSGSGTTTQP